MAAIAAPRRADPIIRTVVGVTMVFVLASGSHAYWYIATHRVPWWTDLASTSAPADDPEHLLRFLWG